MDTVKGTCNRIAYSALKTCYSREYDHLIHILLYGRMTLYCNCMSSRVLSSLSNYLELLFIVGVATVMLLLTGV